MKKGFTLVELLAVIIILGLLAVLITPKVMNTINESKQKTNMASANGLLKAAEYRYQDDDTNGISQEIIIDYETKENIDKLEYNGKQPEKGKVVIKKDGRIAFAVKIGDNCYLKTYNSNEITVETYSAATCNGNSKVFANPKIAKLPGTVQSDGAKYLTDAIEVYYNPTTGEKCSSSDSVSTTGTTTGCLHWYLYSVKVDYANMLLDHNITEAYTENGVWASHSYYAAGLTQKQDGNYEITEGQDSKALSAGISYPDSITYFPIYINNYANDRGPLTALNILRSLTMTWKTGLPKVPNTAGQDGIEVDPQIVPASKNDNKYQINYGYIDENGVGYHARLLTSEEASYLGCTSSSNSCPQWMIKGTIRENSNTYSNIQGYWTSSPRNNRNGDIVSFQQVITYDVVYYQYNGVRPVITVLVDDVLDN